MSRQSLYAELQQEYSTSTSNDVRWLQALFALGAYLNNTPATGSSYQGFVDALTAANAPAAIIVKVQQIFGTQKLAPHTVGPDRAEAALKVDEGVLGHGQFGQNY